MNFLMTCVKRVKYFFSKERCYTEREKEGVAIFNCCCGVVGGDKETGYLQYGCIDCKYLNKI